MIPLPLRGDGALRLSYRDDAIAFSDIGNDIHHYDDYRNNLPEGK